MPKNTSGPEDVVDIEHVLDKHGGVLLRVAFCSIEHGVAHGKALSVDPADYAPALRATAASFVTLRLDGKLRGCVGKSHAVNPLVADVAENAFAAAFGDPRFKAVSEAEADRLDIEVSVLSQPEPLPFEGEADLLFRLRPGIDGVILACGDKRGLFLPDVWDSVAGPREFLAQLKIKAGFDADYWSADFTAQRFVTASTSLSERSGTE